VSKPARRPPSIVQRTFARATLAIGAALLLGLSSASAGEKVITPIGQVGATQKGQFVTVQGEIAEEHAFKSGMRYLLRDDGATITLVLFERALEQSPGIGRLLPGALVQATGKVGVYRDEWQIVPIRGSDVLIVKPAPPMPLRRIGDLKPEDEGHTVVLSGRLTDADSFSAGFKFQLEDGSGQMALTLFERVYDSLDAPERVNLGAEVRVTGTLSFYRGVLEIAPVDGGRLRVLSSPVRNDVKERTLASISSDDQGQWVRVTATVFRLGKAGEALIRDHTGLQRLRLKGAIAKRVALKPNDQIEAVGKVRYSRKQEEMAIEVVLPTDIRVSR
jgi:DNA/RNA endonuclease YhcR with UshA esterase domain